MLTAADRERARALLAKSSIYEQQHAAVRSISKGNDAVPAPPPTPRPPLIPKSTLADNQTGSNLLDSQTGSKPANADVAPQKKCKACRTPLNRRLVKEGYARCDACRKAASNANEVAFKSCAMCGVPVRTKGHRDARCAGCRAAEPTNATLGKRSAEEAFGLSGGGEERTRSSKYDSDAMDVDDPPAARAGGTNGMPAPATSVDEILKRMRLSVDAKLNDGSLSPSRDSQATYNGSTPYQTLEALLAAIRDFPLSSGDKARPAVKIDGTYAIVADPDVKLKARASLVSAAVSRIAGVRKELKFEPATGTPTLTGEGLDKAAVLRMRCKCQDHAATTASLGVSTTTTMTTTTTTTAAPSTGPPLATNMGGVAPVKRTASQTQATLTKWFGPSYVLPSSRSQLAASSSPPSSPPARCAGYVEIHVTREDAHPIPAVRGQRVRVVVVHP